MRWRFMVSGVERLQNRRLVLWLRYGFQYRFVLDRSAQEATGIFSTRSSMIISMTAPMHMAQRSAIVSASPLKLLMAL